MPDKHHLTLQQADRARSDFEAITNDLDLIKVQLVRLAAAAGL